MQQRLYSQRLVLLSALFGITFGILFLFLNDFFAIVVCLLLVASVVFASSKEDLRLLRKARIFWVLAVVILVFTVTASSSAYSYLGGYLFYGLTGVDALLLVAYVAFGRSGNSAGNLMSDKTQD